MSAYVNRGNSQVISLSAESCVSEEVEHHLPTLPKIAQELESFFATARQIEAALFQERTQVRRYRDELKEGQLREEKQKSQLVAQRQKEKNLHEQVNDLCQQLENLRNEKKKREVEVEITKASLEHAKRSEASIKSELVRYKSAWSKVAIMDTKAKQVFQQSTEIQRKLDEQMEILEREKRRREVCEELLQKEKREKQVALTCLHSAEARLSQVSRELDELKTKRANRSDDSGLELNF